MEYPQFETHVARVCGYQIANGCAIQPDAMDGSYAAQVGDDDIDETFDFQGYYREDKVDTRAANSQLELAANYQNFDDSQHDQYAGSGVPGEVDEHGCRNKFESALAFHSTNPLKSHLFCFKASCFEEDLVDPLGSVDMAQLATVTAIEKWDVDKTTMEFLTSVLVLSASCDSLRAHCGLRPHLRNFKLEEPALLSDAATDMLRLRQRNIVRLVPKGFKSFPSDKRHDQGLQWSARSLRLPNDMEKLVAAEKLTVNGETRSLLKEVFEDMNGDILMSISNGYQYRAHLIPVTPPLLPLSPTNCPDSIPSVAAQLPFMSTPEDPLVREGMNLDAQMMEIDTIDAMPADGSQIDVYSPLKAAANSSSSPLRRKFDKISDLKLSSPLLPAGLSEPPAKKSKSVSFAEELQTIVPQRDSDSGSTDPLVAADQALIAISAMIEPGVQIAMEKAVNEQLVELDTTARLDVPAIDDIAPEVPWTDHCTRRRALLGDIRAVILRSDKRWNGASNLERILPWSPFPAHLGKPKPEGDFDDGSLARYLSELGIEEDVDVRKMIRKPDGLRVLDLDDKQELDLFDYKHSDADQDCSSPCYGMQVASMVEPDSTKSLHFSSQLPRDNNRTLPVDAAAIPLAAKCNPYSHSLRMTTSMTVEPDSMQALLEKRRIQLQLEKATLNANLRSNTQKNFQIEDEQASVGKRLGASARSGNLSTFMAVQGVREVPRKEVRKPRRAEAKGESARHAPTQTQANSKVEIPAPRIVVTKSRLPVVVSSAVLGNRQLMRRLQQHLPTLDVIERESAILKCKQINISSSLAREADLTLSPSTGLVFTTLQKLKQKSLPGQEASFVGIHEQYARVAPRYERLIVLLSEGFRSTCESQTHIRALDERDSAAIADFIGFFSRLDTEVQVSYIPGGEEELVKWIAAAVAQWAPCIEGFNLLDEQTIWENFLCQAGMNVFAAQVVLHQLKPLVSQLDVEESAMLCSSESERCGLAAFVRMDGEERIQRFGSCLGGKRLIRRVTLAIDGPWKVGGKGN